MVAPTFAPFLMVVLITFSKAAGIRMTVILCNYAVVMKLFRLAAAFLFIVMTVLDWANLPLFRID